MNLYVLHSFFVHATDEPDISKRPNLECCVPCWLVGRFHYFKVRNPFAYSPIKILPLLLFTIPDHIMAEHVLRTWNKMKEIPNYELVAGELLFRR
jgi:hypothetical protein